MTAVTLSLLDRKYAKRFDMLDAGRTGLVGRAEFTLLAQRLVDGLGVPVPSARADRVRSGYLELWEALCRVAGRSPCGGLTRAEFTTAMHRLTGDRPGFKRMIEPLARLNLTLCDSDGDGHLDEGEFAALLRLLNAVPGTEAAVIFRRLDADGDGLLPVPCILEAFCDFYSSNDPDAPGNVLFGAVPTL